MVPTEEAEITRQTPYSALPAGTPTARLAMNPPFGGPSLEALLGPGKTAWHNPPPKLRARRRGITRRSLELKRARKLHVHIWDAVQCQVTGLLQPEETPGSDEWPELLGRVADPDCFDVCEFAHAAGAKFANVAEDRII